MRTPPLIILILTAAICLAQTNITGKVIDENNEPLIGVNVSIKDASTGTITDFEGNFALDIPDSKSILVFSYMGYKTKEMAAPANRKPMVVQLFEDKQLLDEVVVVGYQDMKKRDVSGSVSSVDVGEIQSTCVRFRSGSGWTCRRCTGILFGGYTGRNDEHRHSRSQLCDAG